MSYTTDAIPAFVRTRRPATTDRQIHARAEHEARLRRRRLQAAKGENFARLMTARPTAR